MEPEREERNPPSTASLSPISAVYKVASNMGSHCSFRIVAHTGPPHRKVFITKCRVGDMTVKAKGTSIKKSKKAVAKKMLAKLRNLPTPNPLDVLNQYEPITNTWLHGTIDMSGHTCIEEDECAIVKLNHIYQDNLPEYRLLECFDNPVCLRYETQLNTADHTKLESASTAEIAMHLAAQAHLRALECDNRLAAYDLQQLPSCSSWNPHTVADIDDDTGANQEVATPTANQQAVCPTGANQQVVSPTGTNLQAVSSTGANQQAVIPRQMLRPGADLRKLYKKTREEVDAIMQQTTGSKQQAVRPIGAQQQEVSPTGAEQAVSPNTDLRKLYKARRKRVRTFLRNLELKKELEMVTKTIPAPTEEK